jgi:mercuric ion transport protein
MADLLASCSDYRKYLTHQRTRNDNDMSNAATHQTGSSAVRDQTDSSSLDRGQKLAAVGALAASSCCILSVILFSIGIGGAWIGTFAQLAPYQPYFIAATLAFIATGYWLVYRSSKAACAASEACARPLPNRLVKIALIAATRHRHRRVDVRLCRTLRAVIIKEQANDAVPRLDHIRPWLDRFLRRPCSGKDRYADGAEHVLRCMPLYR